MTAVKVAYFPDPAKRAFMKGMPLYGFAPRDPSPMTIERFSALVEVWRQTTPAPEDRSIALICGELPDGRLALVPHEIYPQAKFISEEQ